MKLVKVLFNQRRKQLRNTLKNYLKPRIGNKTEVFMNFLDEKNPFFLNNRTEVLSYKNFIDLYKEIVFFKDNG
jgi:16S rRNA A1518/A1519 N6-dimethyltransferase RsmA/KsgA/DIM1 with predicted DNA glycosylase/AP lyase activity